MTARKPLVIIDGQVQQLSSSDTLDAVYLEQEQVILTNGETGSVIIGEPVYISAASTAKKAKADASGTTKAVAFVKDVTITTGTTGAYLTSGILTATTGQWDAVAGTTGGLTFNTKYYLSKDTAGRITATAPTVAGNYVCPLGIALSTTEFRIGISEPILL
jgi:hypothetical protein